MKRRSVAEPPPPGAPRALRSPDFLISAPPSPSLRSQGPGTRGRARAPGVGCGDAAPLEQERRDPRGSTQSGFKTQWPGDTGQHAWSWPHLSLSCQEQHHMGRVSSDCGQQGSCPAEAARHLEVGMARRRNLAVGGEACRLGSQGGPPLRTTWGSALAWLQGPLATPAQDLLPCPTPMPCPAHSPDLQGTRETAGPGLVGHYESPRGKTLITL